MKKITRNFIGALFIGGAIATGLVINSTSAFAAELDDVETTPTILEETAPQTDSPIQSMEDAVEIIENNADIEAGYLEQAKEEIGNETITKESATEILNDGTEIMEQSTELKETVDENYEAIVSETEEAKEDFNEAADDYDLSENAQAVEAAETDEEKIDKLDETAKDAEAKHEDFISTKGEDSKDYKDVCDEITEWNETVAQFQEEYNEAVKEFQELNSKYEELAAYLNNYDEEAAKYEAAIAALQADLDALHQQLAYAKDNLDITGENYSNSLNSLNEVIDELHAAEENLERAADQIIYQDISLDLEHDPTLYNTDYEQELNNYNRITQILNQRSEEALKLGNDYSNYRSDYISANMEIIGKEGNLAELKEEYDNWRNEHPYDVKKSEYDKTVALIVEATTKKDNKERSLTFKKNYLTYLENIKNGFDANISIEADNYTAIRDAITRYIEALNDNILAKALKTRADESFAKTSDDYQELRGIVRDYKSTQNRQELEQIFQNISDASNELDKAVQTEETYETQIKESVKQNILTPFKADEIDLKSDAVYVDARKNNEDVHNNYVQFINKVNELVEDADPIFDVNNDGTIDENENNMVIFTVNYVNNIVSSADSQLNKVDNSYNEIGEVYTAYNVDVVEIDNETEYPAELIDGAAKVVVHFVGKLKGNLEKIALAEELEEYLDYIYAISGTFTTTITDQFGSTHTEIQPIDALGDEFKKYFIPQNA